VGAGAVGLLAAELLHRRAVGRLGGVTGDVMGAMGEVAATAVLLAAGALWV
jgi:adenosylcobinamide-GDP ribazoletransferase